MVHDHANHHDHDKENRHKLGLEAEGPHFKIDGKKFNIYSGEIHYFRVHPEYWEHRLGQLAASGLNTVRDLRTRTNSGQKFLTDSCKVVRGGPVGPWIP